MTALFRRRSNTIFRASLVACLLAGLGTWAVSEFILWSPYSTDVGVSVLQPVPFSHQHHVGQLGLDCRYCHSTVEKTATAGMPTTHTCMTCHSQIWQNAPMLEPVRASYREGRPIAWNRVYRLPKYVYFNHSIHVQKGIGCTSCHGAIDRMPLTAKANPFYMKNCLSCHLNPEKQIRPREEVANSRYLAPQDPRVQLELGARLVREYHIPKSRLTDCYTCHR